MGWDALLFGELEFPKGAVAQWKELVVEEGLFKDRVWKNSRWMGDPSETTTVAGMLAKLEDHSRWCDREYKGPDYQFVRIDGDRVTMRAYINEDDFRSWRGDVATMFRVGEKVGAKGEYVAIANDDMSGERLVLDGKASRCEPIDLIPVFAGGEVPEGALDYAAIIEETIQAMTTRIRKKSGPAKKTPAKKAAKKAKMALAKKAPGKKGPAKKAPGKKAPAMKAKKASKKRK